MKKIITITIAAFCLLVAFGQSQTINKKHCLKVGDNHDILSYYPEFVGGKYSDKLNGIIKDMYKEVMSPKARESVKANASIEEMLLAEAEFMKQLGLTKSIEPIPFNYYSNWHYFENDYVISLIIDHYSSNNLDNIVTKATIINLNAKTGEVINPVSFIQDTVKLIDMIGDKFCVDNRLPQDALRLRTGLKYELADLPMAKTVGFSDIGVVFFYNRGEIAQKSVPAIKVELPYAKFKNITVSDFMKNSHSDTDGEAPTMVKVKKLIKEGEKIGKHKRRN